MLVEDKIQVIKDKGLFGNLIEVGAGCPVYAELCNHANTASKIVNIAFSPNNWETNKAMYCHDDNTRAVGPEVAENLFAYNHNFRRNKKVNFQLTNTIQISNTSDVQTHGWFAMYSYLPNTNILKLYHFTINGFRTRKEYIEIISYIGIDILASCNNIDELDNGYIDCILDNTYKNVKPNIKDTLTAIMNGKMNIFNVHNTTTILRVDGTIDRFNTLLREKWDNLVIIKGSFNPVHPQHIELINSLYRSSDLIGPCKPVFCISLYNRDTTKRVDIDSLLKRIKVIHALGYDVIVDCFGQYHYSYASIINNVDYKSEMNIHYVMGSDIMQKFLQDEHVLDVDGDWKEDLDAFNNKWDQCTFWYDKRPGFEDFTFDESIEHVKHLPTIQKELSSTQIRELIDSENFTELELHIDIKLINIYREFYGKSESK